MPGRGTYQRRRFHLPRWRRWRDHVAEALRTGAAYAEEEFEASPIRWEERWIAGRGGGADRLPAPAATREAARTLRARHDRYLNPAEDP